MIKNDLFLKALRGETVERPPVWMMRQAGVTYQNSSPLEKNTISLHAVELQNLPVKSRFNRSDAMEWTPQFCFVTSS